ncbi:MAG: 16S rRNA (guanine(966)-N(2))-methyltransferase RsmD [Paracoccaceae bacterium]|jgi:16S rRNA (guanine966-N2)-methyltransferase
MRIIGGTYRGIRLSPVRNGDVESHLRPTSDRLRETIFNLLINGREVAGNPVQNAHVLDLFSGTGALGLEALSRGAKTATFVDNGQVAQALLRRNIEILLAQGITELYQRSATKIGPNRGRAFSLIFLDPPYGKQLGEAALASCIQGNWIADGAVIIWEDNCVPALPPNFTLLDQRQYSGTIITIAQAPKMLSRITNPKKD